MKALVLSDSNDPSSIQIEDRELPQPRVGEIRVKMLSMGLNRADTLYPAGKYFFKPKSGSRLGFEGAGIVDAVGDRTTLKKGAMVAICPSSFDVHENGCFAEYGIYPEKALIPTPNNVSHDASGSIWMAYLTAWGGMVEAGNLHAGQTVVITAASSSVGIAAMQIANMLGAIPIASTTSAEKAEQLRLLGAKHVIIQEFPRDEIDKSNAHYVYQIQKITEQRGSDLVFDAVAGPLSHGLIKGSKQGGCVVIHGLLDRRPMDVHAGVLMKRQLMLKGYTVDETLNSIAKKHRAISNITKGFQQGALKPLVADTFPLSKYKEAFETLKANKHIGKLVLLPD